MQNEQAWLMVDKALELNPFNLDAIRLKYQMLSQMGPQHQLAGLLAMLRSNPAQPAIGIQVARLLASVGMVQRSLEWFNQSLELHQRMGIAPPSDVGVDYAAQLFISGDARRAQLVADQLTKTDPNDVDAWMMRLVLARAAGNKEETESLLRQMQIAIANRFAMLRQAAGDKAATTRPVDAGEGALPDPAEEVKYLSSAKPDLVMSQFAPLASATAWAKVYFAQKPGEAVPWIKTLASLVGEDNVMVARLQGWAFLAAGNRDDAKVKLSAVADRDPVAQLGLLKLMEEDPAQKEKIAAEGKKVLAARPSGLTGAVIVEALSKHGVRSQAGGEAKALENVLASLPRDWFKIIDQPNLFYSLRIEPVRSSVPVGEPVLMQVTIQNIREYPLTVGPEGVIHPDLWLDAQLRGIAPQVFPAEAYGRIAGPLVLLPRETLYQIVRLDQNLLLRQLEDYPAASFQISAMVMTNPATIGGQVAKGPAGHQAISKLFERAGVPIQQDAVRQKLAAALDSGSPDEKIRAVETLTKFILLLNAPGANDAAKQIAAQASDAVRRAREDDDPLVSAWAKYRYALLAPNAPELVRAMLQDTVWVTRLFGIVAAELLQEDKSLFKPLAQGDADPVVKRLAAAGMVIDLRPATQPATQPAEPIAPIPGAAPTSEGPILPAPAQPASATRPGS
jgi:tetratricopeptide (TPR) repeat protein